MRATVRETLWYSPQFGQLAKVQREGASPDEGARRIVARYPAFPVEVDDAGILVDIDTEGDLEALRRSVAAALFGGGDWSAASTF